ncbi:MAG TPA: thioredoxin domain-containing protein [Candidatus Methylacidiphilales bacterium]|nr:thioredoxin domain-containing protein [Candidatus Methylacidiphilales bacterium]
MPFAAALQKAQAEHKIVFIDFFTTWCGPCKMLDATTWRDPGVIALLRDKTVALRLDAEKNADLAKRYTVEAYPTLALIKPDGSVIDTLVGYKDAAAFTAAFNDSLAGKTSLASAQAAVVQAQARGGHGYVQARYKLGQELAHKGMDDQALAEFLWCFDDGMKSAPAYSGVRVSFLLGDLGQLARHYPPALDALKQRRDQARQDLEKSPSDFHAAQDFSALNHALDDDKTTLAYFDKLPADSPQRVVIGDDIFDLLLEAKRYSDAVTAQPFANFKELFTTIQQQTGHFSSGRDASLRDFETENAAKEIEALAGAGQLDDARTLIGMVIAADPSPKARAAVGKHLTRAGHPELLPPAP